MTSTTLTRSRRRNEIWLVLGLALATVLLMRLPLIGLLFYPFQLFGTFVHELSHGFAALLTGGGFERFAVHPDLSGVAYVRGGVSWIVASAGYLGSAIFGSALVWLAARGAPARTVLAGLGITLGLLCLLFVRNLFGIAGGLLLAAALWFAGRSLSALWAEGLLLFLAVQMMLNAVDSLFALLHISTFGGPHNDAAIMAGLTGIPALFWALLWTVSAIAILAWSLRRAYRL
jgi:hypothetical protein